MGKVITKNGQDYIAIPFDMAISEALKKDNSQQIHGVLTALSKSKLAPSGSLEGDTYRGHGYKKGVNFYLAKWIIELGGMKMSIDTYRAGEILMDSSEEQIKFIGVNLMYLSATDRTLRTVEDSSIIYPIGKTVEQTSDDDFEIIQTWENRQQ